MTLCYAYASHVCWHSYMNEPCSIKCQYKREMVMVFEVGQFALHDIFGQFLFFAKICFIAREPSTEQVSSKIKHFIQLFLTENPENTH